MKDDRPIWLTSLAEADRGTDAPDSIEARLQGALRRRRVIHTVKRSGAVGIVAALAVSLWLAPKKPVLNEGLDPADDSLLDAISEATLLAPDDDSIGEDFVPTKLASEQPLESVRIVRVSLPGGALTRYGVPASEISANAEVTADLLVGQDGIARAIRVVK